MIPWYLDGKTREDPGPWTQPIVVKSWIEMSKITGPKYSRFVTPQGGYTREGNIENNSTKKDFSQRSFTYLDVIGLITLALAIISKVFWKESEVKYSYKFFSNFLLKVIYSNISIVVSEHVVMCRGCYTFLSFIIYKLYKCKLMCLKLFLWFLYYK